MNKKEIKFNSKFKKLSRKEQVSIIGGNNATGNEEGGTASGGGTNNGGGTGNIVCGGILTDPCIDQDEY
ncbi:hypothetical protein [Chryseobacterium populi]|uniref:Uncharacterized protein n=1 Tax=Chryseobacterium populi TaxID=1144316 RepID=J3CIL0_9FLAO|nr:hypothetical protein [Chryseobacterium populi]EJL72166.1 hypothetical protein PMI13_02004 [Chryseobacterium populi]